MQFQIVPHVGISHKTGISKFIDYMFGKFLDPLFCDITIS